MSREGRRETTERTETRSKAVTIFLIPRMGTANSAQPLQVSGNVARRPDFPVRQHPPSEPDRPSEPSGSSGFDIRSGTRCHAAPATLAQGPPTNRHRFRYVGLDTKKAPADTGAWIGWRGRQEPVDAFDELLVRIPIESFLPILAGDRHGILA